MKFKNQEVEAKYSSDHPSDPVVHLPGGKNGNGWKGKLSEIPIEQADRWINRPGQNLLKVKDPQKTTKGKDLKTEN